VHSATAQNEGMRFGTEPVPYFYLLCNLRNLRMFKSHLPYDLLGLLTNGLSRTQNRQGFLIQLSA
jgi:hypothetical protein